MSWDNHITMGNHTYPKITIKPKIIDQFEYFFQNMYKKALKTCVKITDLLDSKFFFYDPLIFSKF